MISNLLLSPEDEDLRPMLKKSGKHVYVIDNGRLAVLHQLIAQRMYGSTECASITHIDLNVMNNRRDNLRITRVANDTGKIPRGLSGYRGVHWRSQAQKWHACIMIGGKSKHLGFFNCKIDAAIAYDKAAIDLFGQFTKLNFPIEATA